MTPQYVLLLTGNAKARPESIKPALAKLIALEFDCDYDWLLHGKESENKPTINVHTCEGPLRSLPPTYSPFGLITRLSYATDLALQAKRKGILPDAFPFWQVVPI